MTEHAIGLSSASGVREWRLLQIGGRGAAAHFFSPASLRPGLDALTRNFSAICAEWDARERFRSGMPLYHAVDPVPTRISGTLDADRNWHVFMRYLLGY
jgi:hypothetical protein